jgi:hypothetical protein
MKKVLNLRIKFKTINSKGEAHERWAKPSQAIANVITN